MSHSLQRTHLEREVYLEASRLHDPKAIATFLDEACRGNKPLRIRIERLLSVTPRTDLLKPDPRVRDAIARLANLFSNGDKDHDNIL